MTAEIETVEASAASFTTQRGSSLPDSKPFALRFNSLKNCYALVAASSVISVSESSSSTVSAKPTRASCATNAENVNQNIQHHLQLQPQASFKVAVLGGAGGIGQPLALLLKMSSLVFNPQLYDIQNAGTEVVDGICSSY